jgi:hypothetical protein
VIAKDLLHPGLPQMKIAILLMMQGTIAKIFSFRA